MRKDKLAIIVPVYNEEEMLPEGNQKLQEILAIMYNKDLVDKDSFIMYVDDGSTDSSWEIIRSFNSEFANVMALRFERNSGQQQAMKKGLEKSMEYADVFITIDADLQDDPYAMIEMVEKYRKGNKIVYGVRNNRDSDTLFYKACANLYYKVLKLLDVKSVSGHSEFRLMSRDVVEEIVKYNQTALYIRGICAQMNVKSDSVYYARQPRTKGASKYNYKSLMDVAFDGITNAGPRPLMLILHTGFFMLLVGISILIVNLFYDNEPLYGLLFILFGINMLALSAVGQYVGRILSEVQHHPKNKQIEFLKNKKGK